MKKIKKRLLRILLYTIGNLMWTGLMIFGFMQNTIY